MEDKIVFVMEGADSHDGHVEFGSFLRELDVLKSTLGYLRKKHGGSRDLTFLVSYLSHSSPTAVTVEPSYLGSDKVNDPSLVILRDLRASLEAIQKNEIPQDTDYGLLECLNSLGWNNLTRSTIAVNDDAYIVDSKFSRSIKEVLNRGETSIGSVEGAPEQINIHGKIKHFTICPDIGHSRVKCILTKTVQHEATGTVGKYVTVSGEMSYRPNSSFPHEISVHSIELARSSEDLTTFEELKGIISGNSRAAELIVREVRDVWE